MRLSKLIFMGTPEIAVPSLEQIHHQFPDTEITVFSNPDAPKGRGKKLSPSPVKTAALAKGLSVHTPQSKAEIQDLVEQIHPDLIIIIAYGKLIPAAVCNRYLCVNIHASLLPQYRGASPIQHSLLNRDPETGITLIQINEAMDAGDILRMARVPLTADTRFGELYESLGQLGAQTCVEWIQEDYLSDSITRTPQQHEQATFCHKLSREDRLIDPAASADESLGKIKAFSPKPAANWMRDDGQMIKIIDARIEDGAIVPLTVQAPGKGPIPYKDYCLGNPPLSIGEKS
mgnify:CR=1 FL=1